MSRIIPEKKLIIAAIKIKPQTIRVGNLGTSPVLKYSTKTGIAKITEINVKIADMIPKK